MAIIDKAGVYTALAAAMLLVGTAHALSPANKCEASKLSTAGKYDFCRLKAEAKAAKSGGTPDFSKCDPKFSGKWTQAESKASGMCPSNGDEAAVQAFITEHTDALAAALDGGTLPEGVLSCNADLATCNGSLASCTANLSACEAAQKGLLKTGQTTSYGTGSDGDLQKGASHSFTDNGDGTITDNTTGLMWEKKDQPNGGGIHDYSITYTWGLISSPYTMNGTMVTTFLAALNGGAGFAGHTDWRIPNVTELQSIANYQNANPAVDTVFNTNCNAGCIGGGSPGPNTCSCTQKSNYWASTTYQLNPQAAWNVYFVDGEAVLQGKATNLYVRAVRGGS